MVSVIKSGFVRCLCSINELIFYSALSPLFKVLIKGLTGSVIKLEFMGSRCNMNKNILIIAPSPSWIERQNVLWYQLYNYVVCVCLCSINENIVCFVLPQFCMSYIKLLVLQKFGCILCLCRMNENIFDFTLSPLFLV